MMEEHYLLAFLQVQGHQPRGSAIYSELRIKPISTKNQENYPNQENFPNARHYTNLIQAVHQSIETSHSDDSSLYKWIVKAKQDICKGCFNENDVGKVHLEVRPFGSLVTGRSSSTVGGIIPCFGVLSQDKVSRIQMHAITFFLLLTINVTSCFNFYLPLLSCRDGLQPRIESQ